MARVAPPEDLPPPAAPPDEIRGAAEEVLARPEFAEPPKSIYERIVEALNEALNDALSALFAGGRTAIAAWIALAVVLGLVGFLLYRLASGMRATAAVVSPLRVETETRRPAVAWDREADEHAAAGRWRDAVRCRYRALVARLAAGGAVEEVPGRTAGEYRLALRSTRPGAAGPFGEATDLFERAWYGDAPTSGPDEARLRALAEDVLSESGG